MLGTKIQTLRKNKGYSQEVLAEKLNVVRQTISKWEKELSVPDAEMLKNIAEALDVPISELLDGNEPAQDVRNDLNAIARQLEIINEQYASQNAKRRKMLTKIGIAVVCLIVLCILASILPIWSNMWHDFGKNLYHAVNMIVPIRFFRGQL